MTPEGWTAGRIDEFGKVQGGRQRSPHYTAGTLKPYLRVANVFDGYIDTQDVLHMYFTDAECEVYRLEPGDILLEEGQSLELVGRSAVYAGDPPDCCFQNTLIRFRSYDGTDADFAHNVFQFLWHTGRFARIASQTTSIAHLGVSRFAALRVAFPPLAEQKAIASVLWQWQSGIGRTESLMAAKEELKHGIVQQLLIGKRRFPGVGDEPWQEHRLGDLFLERRETGRSDLPLLAITADRGVINRDKLDKKDTSNPDKAQYKRIAPGDIGYNTMRMWQGVSALSRLEGIVSPAYTVCTARPAMHAEFAAHLFKYRPMVHCFLRHSQGLVSDTLNLKYHNFAQIRVAIPGVAEQHRIAECLDECDREVELLRAQRDALRTQRRGLLQKLLTGQIRVKEGTP